MAIALLSVVAGLKPKTQPSPDVPSRVGHLSKPWRQDDFLWNGCFECVVSIDAGYVSHLIHGLCVEFGPGLNHPQGFVSTRLRCH